MASFQNGVLKDSYLRAAYEGSHLIGGVAYVATTVSEPGVITRIGPLERLIFGEFDGRRSARVEAFHSAGVAGGINAEVSGDIRREIWEKFVFLVGLSATTSTIRVPIGPIRENPQTGALLLDIMREVVAVGRAHGVPLPEDYAEQRLAFADGVAPDMTSSMHHDLERGKPLEVRWLSGGDCRARPAGRRRNAAEPCRRRHSVPSCGRSGRLIRSDWRLRSLVHGQLEQVRSRIVANYVEVELATCDFVEIDVGEQDRLAVPRRADQDVAERSDDAATAGAHHVVWLGGQGVGNV